MLCWTRDDEQLPSEHWQAEQLKLLRGTLDRKTSLCEKLAEELRRAQAELDEKNSMIMEVRSSLATSHADLRASTAECAQHTATLEQLRKQVAALPQGRTLEDLVEELEQLRAQSAQLMSQTVPPQIPSACHESPIEELERLRQQVAAFTSQTASRISENMAEGSEASFIEELLRLKIENAALKADIAATQSSGTRSTPLINGLDQSSVQDAAPETNSALEELQNLRAEVAALNSQIAASSSQGTAPEHLVNELAQLKKQFASLPEGKTIQDVVLIVEAASDREKASRSELLQEHERCEDALRMVQTLRAETDEKLTEVSRERDDALRLLQAARHEADEKLNEVIKEREEALRLLQATRLETDQEVSELNKELKMLSTGLEQREEDVLSIQFDMVALQNQLLDQANLVRENADSFQWASEELAEKDEKFDEAVKQLEAQRTKQDELRAQIDEVSSQFQAKVADLSQELESSRAAYHALEDHTTKVVQRLEADRDAMAVELERFRAESKKQTALLRTESMQREEAAKEVRHRLEDELSSALASLEQTKGSFEQRHKSLSPDVLQTPSSTPRNTANQKREQELQELLAVSTEQLAVKTEDLAIAEAKLQEYSTALERSRLLERQALEQAKESRLALEMEREIPSPLSPPKRDTPRFSAAAPRMDKYREEQSERIVDLDTGLSADELPVPVSLPNVLIAVELFLGDALGKAELTVTPWQTRSDFHTVVDDFLKEHKVKPMFADVLVQYLEDVEDKATTFPVIVQASLTDLYDQYA